MGQGFALFAGIASDVIKASAREAEALGYASFWVNHPGSTDGLAALAQAAGVTTRVALGVGSPHEPERTRQRHEPRGIADDAHNCPRAE